MNKILSFIENKTYIVLCCIIALGLFFRVLNLKDNTIVAYDQARDAQRVMEIMQKNFKIVGPETDIPGVFNGPLFYYILTPIYALTAFNINYAALVFVFINLSGILLVYLSSQVLFNNKKISLLSAFLWAISYEQMNFARFISNASPMSICTIVFFLGLAYAIFKKKEVGLAISVIGLAAAIHFNFYLVYLFIFYPILFIFFKYRPSLKMTVACLSLLGLLLSPFVIAEIRWQFMAIKSLLGYISHQSTNYTSQYELFASILNNGKRYYDRISEAISYSLFSYGKFVGFIILFLFLEIIWKNRKRTEEKNRYFFLCIWFFSTLPLFLFKSGVLNAQVINSSIFAPLAIIFAGGIYYLSISNAPKSVKIVILLLIICSNVFQMGADNFQNIKLFALQPLTLSIEKKMIDYSYESSKKKHFSICGVTNPLFVNTLWSFLYSTYGKNKYGYVPSWSGQKQISNSSYLPYDIERAQLRYLIIEPLGGIPENAKEATIYLEDKVSRLLEEKSFGDLTIQKRIIPADKSLLIDTQNLSPEKKLYIENITHIEARYYCSM
ncbi:MAG: hypothetical protein V1922_02175 [bacterium]